MKPNLELELKRMVAPTAAVVGVSALHLESGQRVGLNADSTFPMVSVYKVAIAACVLKQVERQCLALAQMIELTVRDLSPGSGLIKDHLTVPGASLSIQNLLRLTLRVSDNSASDLLLRLVGGATIVNNFLRTYGITGLRVDRTTRQMIADFYGVAPLPDEDKWTIEQYRMRYQALSNEAKQAARAAFLQDERDVCTPNAIVDLLTALYSGRLLTAEHRKLLLIDMQHAQGGQNRLKGLLPPGVIVMRKGGAWVKRLLMTRALSVCRRRRGMWS
jgi:beta-lactamase class A